MPMSMRARKFVGCFFGAAGAVAWFALYATIRRTPADDVSWQTIAWLGGGGFALLSIGAYVIRKLPVVVVSRRR